MTDYGLAYDINEQGYVPLQGFKGTFAYAAPELFLQMGDEAGAPTASADMYSLGVILFRALSGEWPHPLDRAKGNYLEIVKMKHSPARGIMDLASGVPPAMAELLSMLLATDPGKRLAEATALAARLEELQEDMR